jgi:hypothetical protein
MQNSARLLDTESIQDQPIGGEVQPTPEERNLLGRYTRGYISVYCDAFGRLAHRNKRDYESISSLFRPVLRSIADHAIDRNGVDSVTAGDTAATIIDDVLRSMEKRAAKWPERISDEDIATLAQGEFIKAIRSIHINVTREIAAAKASAALTPEIQ